jgi:hypothetical protein
MSKFSRAIHAIDELRSAQDDLRMARLRVSSAAQKLEDLNRPDLVESTVLAYLSNTGDRLKEVQIELRVALAGLDDEAPVSTKL